MDELITEDFNLQLKALERENRILRKQLQRSYADREQLESAVDRKETLLRNALNELNVSLQERQEALDTLKHAQAQLVQTEKMSSLGQLVAGIAHEINNPINFIYGNLTHLQDYARDLLSTLEVYRQAAPDLDEELLPIEPTEIDFLAQDTVEILQSMEVGAFRICDIVSSLRNFSRLDEAKRKSGNIHDGIDNSLMILRYRLEANEQRPAIQVIKDYATLSPIECSHGPLNQVFMNLLANAIDAIDSQDYAPTYSSDIEPTIPTLHIHTQELDDSAIKISVSDNGSGIPNEIQSRLFDPFFTTKPTGKGTGLGLAISHEIIVQQHQGSIVIDSELGNGTTFTVTLPRISKTPTQQTQRRGNGHAANQDQDQ